MITMDLKGITWVGNIYEKFETMVLEMEETMYEDTVKYVESQMQTVSDNVRRLYSDVMQDMLLPCSIDPAKQAVSDLPVEPYGDVGICVKPKLGLKDKHTKSDGIEEHWTENPKMTADNDLDHPPTFHGLCHVDNLFPSRLADSAKGAPRRYVKGSKSKKLNLGTNKSFKRENLSANEISRCKIPMDKDLISVSSVCHLSTGNHAASVNDKDKITTSNSAEVTEHDSINESKNEVENACEQMPDIPATELSIDMVNMVESGRSKGMDVRHSSYESLIEESNDVCVNIGLVPLVESSANENLRSSKFDDEECFESNSGRSDEWTTDVSDGDVLIEEELEIIQEVDKANLEETCIMVNGDEFQFVPQSEGKIRPFKKKIRDVFSSRRKSMRKQEYELLAAWCSSDNKSVQDECAKSSAPPLIVKDTRSPTHDLCESEWELL